MSRQGGGYANKPGICEWIRNELDPDTLQTQCGQEFTQDGPVIFVFCPFCGKNCKVIEDE